MPQAAGATQASQGPTIDDYQLAADVPKEQRIVGAQYLRQVPGAAVGTFYPHPWVSGGARGGRWRSPHTTREPVFRYPPAAQPPSQPADDAEGTGATGGDAPAPESDEARPAVAAPAPAQDEVAQDEARPPEDAQAPADGQTAEAALDAPAPRNARNGLAHYKWRNVDKYVLIVSGTPLLDSGPMCFKRGPGLVKYMLAAHLTVAEGEALRAWHAGMAPRRVPRLDGVPAGDDDTIDLEPLCTVLHSITITRRASSRGGNMHVPMNWLTRLGVLLRQLGMIFPKWAFCREKGLKHAHFHLQGLGAVVGDGTAPWLAWVRLVLASIADVRQKCTVNIKPVRPCSRARAARMTREAKTCRLIALRFAHAVRRRTDGG